jgi:hypothetical protein
MYWGTVAHRTIDLFGFHVNRSEWLPPRLSAVHYALSGSFATRNYWLSKWILQTPLLSRAMTLFAMMIELLAPLGCLLDGKRRHWYAFFLFTLHFGLLLVINLPNWQFVGMLTQAVWIPSRVWSPDPVAVAKKTDDTSYTLIEKEPQPLRPNLVSKSIQLFFLSYMLLNWCGNRGWIPKFDGGDIGEGLRLSQYWVMYATVGHTSHNVYLTGIVLEQGSLNDMGEIVPVEKEYNVLQYIKTREWQEQDKSRIYDMSSRYPSPRWERILYQWAASAGSPRKRETRFLQKLCELVNQDRIQQKMDKLDAIEIMYQHLSIQGFGQERYARDKARPDSVYRVDC